MNKASSQNVRAIETLLRAIARSISLQDSARIRTAADAKNSLAKCIDSATPVDTYSVILLLHDLLCAEVMRLPDRQCRTKPINDAMAATRAMIALKSSPPSASAEPTTGVADRNIAATEPMSPAKQTDFFAVALGDLTKAEKHLLASGNDRAAKKVRSLRTAVVALRTSKT